jgi:hypothetical protein
MKENGWSCPNPETRTIEKITNITANLGFINSPWKILATDCTDFTDYFFGEICEICGA